jgi:nicotinamidase-related amidase
MTTPCTSMEHSALLIIDMISDFSFPDGDVLAAEAGKVVDNMVRIRRLFRSRRRPVIYVNDNFRQWNKGFRDLVDWAARIGSRGSTLVDLLRPATDDFYILKPRHSAFYETALPSLLDDLGVHALTIVGVAGDACVLSSAFDAHIRKFALWVPADASASLSRERNVRAMQFLGESLGCDITPASCIDRPVSAA